MRELMRMVLLSAVAVLLLATTGEAGTYYIDYSGGSDASAGTSKAAPWKRAPFMKGFAGAYTHGAGDRFIFKGGVTWPVGVFQMRITAGGSSPTLRDYYGVDTSWFAGSSYSRPLFDFQHTLVGPGWTYAAGVLIEGCNYITIDGLDVANHRAPLELNGVSTWGSTAICMNNAGFVTITNCIVRDWDMPTPIPSGASGGGGIMRVNNGGNNVITHCTLHQAGVPVRSGTAVWNIGELSHSEIHHTCTAFMYGSLAHNNHIHHLENPMDPAAHSNVFLCPGGLTAYNNLIHDISPVAQVIFIAPGFSGPGRDLIYNNVVYNVAQPCIAIDTDGNNNQNASSGIYNNTLVGPGGGGYCVRVGFRNNGSFPLLDCRNNHLITSGNPFLYNNPAGGGANVSSVTLVAQLVQSVAQATAASYTPANQYRPSSSGSPTVMAGLNLSSLLPSGAKDILGIARATGSWDVGAYQYSGAVSGIPPTANSSPVIAAVQSNLLDAAPAEPGFQASEGSTVRLSAAISDPDGNAVTWSWTYSVDGGPSVSFASGSGSAAAASFTYPAGSGSRTYLWKVQASDGVASATAQFAVGVLAPPVIAGTTGVKFEAETGTLQAPFVVADGCVSQAGQTSLASGGRATYTFSVSTAGTYFVSALVNAPGDASNSFFIGMDSEPEDPASVWHVALTSGLEERVISWQGSGAWDASEFDPKYFYLTAGTHKLTVVGREGGAMLDRLSIFKIPAPPVNFRVAKNW